jgi:hypothetical protein
VWCQLGENSRKYARLLGDYERDRLRRSARAARRGGYRPYHHGAPDWLYDLAFVGFWTAISALLVLGLKHGIIGG